MMTQDCKLFHGDQMANRIGVCSWSLQPSDTHDLTQSLEKVGVTRVQLHLNPYADSVAERSGLIRSIDQNQLEVLSGMMTTVGEDYSTLDSIKETGGLRPDLHWDANQVQAERCAAFAKELGLSLVTLHAGFLPEDDTVLHDLMVERIRRIAEIFNLCGICLGLETGQERSPTLLGLLSTLHPDFDIGVNFDPANMILYGMGDPIEAMSELAPHIVQLHMKDAVETEVPGAWGTEMPAGEGEVDWSRFFEILGALEHQPDVLIERESGANRIGDIRTALRLFENMSGR